MTWVKICGITNLEDAQVAVDAGADALGFVFYEKSPRRVDVQTVREIVEKLPASVEKVGVFVNEPAELIREARNRAGLTLIQLSAMERAGELAAELIKENNRTSSPRLIFTMRPDEAMEDAFLSPGSAGPFAILFDTFTHQQPGGTGITFDWQRSRERIQQLSNSYPTIVAGGLTPENVGEAIRLLQPFGVDVSSGVEARAGKKDPAKVRTFMKAAKEAGKQQ
jgi:phosphoribosylanthranilate isomerase